MKSISKFLLLFLSLIILSCSSSEESKEVKQKDIKVFTEFVKDVKSLKKYERHGAFDRMKEISENEASKKMEITKTTINNVLLEAKEYNFCIIFVGDHTLVKIDDFNDCTQSGSWQACMPKGKGYVIKGKWNYKEDFINNIIGTADNQKRVAYFFS